jgi:TRAP-type C4-dicarboxylate transport system substrate-binding protein
MTISISRRRFGAGLAATTAVAGALAGARAEAQATINLKYGNAGNAQTLSNTFNQRWANVVAERTSNQVRIQIFAGTLGGEQQLIESMALGTIDIYNGAYTGTREFDIFYSPSFFKDGYHAKRVLAGSLGQKANETLERRYQARLLGVGVLGPWVLATKRKITSLDELRGVKLRAPQIEGVVASLNHLGASPTPIAFNEIYLALQNGTVDGFVSALNPSVAGKFYEVCKYVYSNPFGLGLDKEAIATRAWNRLSATQRDVMKASFDELENVEYHQAGITAITTDLATWRRNNGDDSVAQLDQADIDRRMAPLNERLANEVFGAGAWVQIQAAANG